MNSPKNSRIASVVVASAVFVGGLVAGSGIAAAETLPPAGSATTLLEEIGGPIFEVLGGLDVGSSLGSSNSCQPSGLCYGIG